MHRDKGRPVFRRHDRVRGKCKRSSIEMFSFVNPIKSKSNTTFVVIRAHIHDGIASRCARHITDTSHHSGRTFVFGATRSAYRQNYLSETKPSQVEMLMPDPRPRATSLRDCCLFRGTNINLTWCSHVQCVQAIIFIICHNAQAK